jgi:mannose-1-phosphate guanylyltransferase
VKALLLAGGLGTRLRPLTENLAKPMALVGNRPWLEHLIVHLKQQGIVDFVIAVKHYPEMIQRYFGDGQAWGVNIEYAVEKKLLGTAGAIKNAETLLSDRFLAVNADIVHQVSLLPLLDFHVKHKGGVTIGLTEVDDPSQFGVVEQRDTGEIIRFVEKPDKESAPSNRINAGIYVMEKEVLKWIPQGREVSIERETFPLLIERNVGVYGTLIDGYWMDLGTKNRYRQVHWDLLDRKLSLPLREKEHGTGILIGEESEVAQGVLIVPPVLIGRRVKIGERSVIGPYAVIGDGCELGKGVRCSETIMWNGCKVRDAAQLKNCIIGYGLELEASHILHEAVMNRTAGGGQG